MTNSRDRMVRNLQIRLTMDFFCKIGTGMIAAPVLFWALDRTGQFAADPATWVLIGAWWVVLGVYVHVLAHLLVRRLDL